MNKYFPEGSYIATNENREYISSIFGLERALSQGKILEGMALMCDSELNITVDLYGIKGIIPKNEVLLGEDQKDIAIITRIGKPVCFKILSISEDSNGKKIAILSRRAAQMECMQNYIMTLICGDIISARVTHMERFGAFVDIGCGIVSLLSVDCISVSRISHPSDRLSVGMSLKCIVKSIDYETKRVYVSQKELLGTWEENASLFKVGQTVAGVIRSIEEYGVFIELAPNLTGLAEVKQGLEIGQSVAVYIKNIIPERMKVKLVVIDSSNRESSATPPDYFIQNETHLERWIYSPKCCGKVIETIFS